MQIDKTKIISKCPLFSSLKDEHIKQIAQLSYVKSFEKGESLFHQDEIANGFYIIFNGIVSIYKISSNGREQIFHKIDNYMPCGEVPTFEGGPYPASAMALTDIKTLYISRNDFIALAQDDSDILLKMLAILSKRLRHFVNLVSSISLKEVNSRLAEYIIKNAKKSQSQSFELKIPKKQLALELGTIPETLSRTFKKLENSGVIKLDKKIIKITDKEKLKEIAKN
jgi:CRP/FNR family transcriptional regulator